MFFFPDPFLEFPPLLLLFYPNIFIRVLFLSGCVFQNLVSASKGEKKSVRDAIRIVFLKRK